jgi:class 3 adenylate cyclase
MICASCGADNPTGFRFCGSCGAALAPAEAPREVRKVVTVLFCDLSGSTELGDRTDPEALRATMRSYYEEMRVIVERHGGTVEKFVGDAVMAVFGVPVAHEDDALRAVRAAWEMRAAVPALGLSARIGANTGEVVAGEGDSLVTGDAVNVAARLEQAAAPGEVLIGAETRRLVRDAVTIEPVAVEAKGKGTVDAFRLTAVDPAAPALARRLDAPLVGRERELELLRQAVNRAVGESACHLFTLLGAAGVGKSRLAAEFLAGVDAQVIRGRCLDYGDGITFWPVAEALKQLGPRADAVLGQIAGGAGSPNELFWAIRMLLEDVARERPLVVVFDDIHWGEPTFLDLLDHVADLSRGAPILLLCLARPELLDERPGWGGGKLNATTLLLEPLTAEECTRLIEELGHIDDETRLRIVQTADGNPLFAEEMVALALDGGDVRVPGTIHALLQARLDQLRPDERTVMERGAVEGQVFHRSAVSELAPPAVRDGVRGHLVGLVRKELIRPEQATFPGDDAFRFRHLLIRDAAYEALPKETRAELHERFADWLEQRTELIELDEIVGYHLEQAAVYRRELGGDADRVAARAGARLARAGEAAVGRSDLHAAKNLLGRSLALLPPDDSQRPEAVLALAGAEQGGGDYARSLELLDPLVEWPDLSVASRARVLREFAMLDIDPERAYERGRAVLADVLPKLERLGDDKGLASAYLLAAGLDWHRSRARPAAVSLRKALEHARLAGDQRAVSHAAYTLSAAGAWGPADPDEQAAISAELAELGRGSAAVANARRYVGLFSAMGRGDFDEARALNDALAATNAELGERVLAAANRQGRLLVELHAGNREEAVAVGQEGYRMLVELGAPGYASTSAVFLAIALELVGRLDEAERLAIEGEEAGGPADVVNFAVGRAVRARVAAQRGELAEAERFGRDAVRYALEMDFLWVHGEAYRALAFAQAAAGRQDEARSSLESALAAYRDKGDLPMVDLTERLLAELSSRPAPTG